MKTAIKEFIADYPILTVAAAFGAGVALVPILKTVGWIF